MVCELSLKVINFPRERKWRLLERLLEEVNYLYYIEINTFTADERQDFTFAFFFFPHVILSIFRKGGLEGDLANNL